MVHEVNVHAIVGLKGRMAQGRIQQTAGEGVWEVPSEMWHERLAFSVAFLEACGGGSMVVVVGEVPDEDFEQD